MTLTQIQTRKVNQTKRVMILCKSSFTCDRNIIVVDLCFWSPSTNTMKLRFGMMTLTLLDLTTIAGFQPCCGVVSALSQSKCEIAFSFTKKEQKLQDFYGS